MGDRVSVQFDRNGDKSVVLFSHWGGMELVKEAKKYVKLLKEERKGQMMPIDRFEPATVMVDFVRWLTKDMERVESDYYIVGSTSEGDNGDNGHHIIKL